MKTQTQSAPKRSSKTKLKQTSRQKFVKLARKNLALAASIIKIIAVATPRTARQFYYFSRSHGLVFCGLSILWIVIAILSIGLIKQSHTTMPTDGVRDNLITTNAVSPNFVFIVDVVQLLAIVAILVLLVLTLVAIRRAAWRKVMGAINLGVIVLGLVFIQAITMYANDTAVAANYSAKTPPSLSQVIVQRAECGDAIHTINDYSYGAKNFYELKDKGWQLAATYNSPTGELNSPQACQLYYSIRSKHTANHILLQLYTVGPNGQILPYTYNDIGHSQNGIFVKD